jgi:hypothetical protein
VIAPHSSWVIRDMGQAFWIAAEARRQDHANGISGPGNLGLQAGCPVPAGHLPAYPLRSPAVSRAAINHAPVLPEAWTDTTPP